MNSLHLANDRIHSVSTPNTFAYKNPLDYYQVNSALPGLSSIVECTEERIPLLNSEMQTFLKILFLYCLRFIELYNCRLSNYIKPDRFILFGAKSSSSILIYIPNANKIVDAVASANGKYFFPNITYNKCYIALGSINIKSDIMFMQNEYKTHYARKKFHQLAGNACTDKVLTDILHHKSIDSAKYYNNTAKRNI